jgi:SHS family sialic acid transporter-like MFS transporter
VANITFQQEGPSRGKWLALAAALLGWMFDGFEMGLFSLVGRPALQDLLPGAPEADIGRWFAVAMAVFLVGAASGGVLFGWLGDRLGRVRAMMLSILTYAIFTGFCGLAQSAWQVMVLRFIAALGMGGEWSLGVALVTEIWPDRTRAFMAGLIGAAANVGFFLTALLGLGLTSMLEETRSALCAVGLPDEWVAGLLHNKGWRFLMILGAAPALLTFLIRVYVPESERWKREQGRGTTSNWAARDLSGVLVGAAGSLAIIFLWATDLPLAVQIAGTVAGLLIVTAGYTFPVIRYLQRCQEQAFDPEHAWRPTLGRMLLGACLSGVALLGTWGSLQWAPTWADQLTNGSQQAKEYTVIWSGLGAIVGTLAAAWMGNRFGRRPTYFLLCLASLASAVFLFRFNTAYGTTFLFSAFLAGGCTASFYGWLPLYLPELFRTGVRATGQGFSFNFGRILAAVGVLQTGNLMGLFGGSYPVACSLMSLIYLVGLGIIWLGPETRGRPLPE